MAGTLSVPGAEESRFDVIVVGAGINGAGIARDAALRGLRVLLLDKSGIGSGTSSWSTRLIHGGLRYLEHYEIGLVRESLREREILLRIAPHLVRPLPFLIPIYEDNKRGPLLIRLGMMAYDALSLDKSVPHHSMLTRDELLRRDPGLKREGLRAAALYYDAQVEYPERLAFENALSAREQGAVIHTYAHVDSLLTTGKRVDGVAFTDLLEGTRHQARAPITINAAGPWVDELLANDRLHPDRQIGGTKGSHVVVMPFPGAPHEALYVEAGTDHRPYFIVPWNDMYLIGTTDTRYESDLNTVVPDESEIDYLIRETNGVIPDAGLTRDAVLYAYAGVRPLPFKPAGSEGGITRSHIIRDHAPEIEGLVSIVGGKLTTYRSLAQEAVDMLYRKMGKKPSPCATARVPLPGARTADYAAFAHDFASGSGLPEEASRQLLRVYGTRSTQVVENAHGDADLLTPFSDTGAIGAEVPFSFEKELARTLRDSLQRCTMVGWGPSVGIGADEKAVEIAVRHLGWTQDRAREEVAAYRKYVERYKPRSLLPQSRDECPHESATRVRDTQ
ncbi:MAG: glycerol-3-phosphate dehydrogenase [Chloroflexota bacterium]|nr:MAG: glycerol-3-phosphate dehydrogenase [Chloroflexota bacterium]